MFTLVVFVFLFFHFTAWFSLVYPVMDGRDDNLAYVLAMPVAGSGLMFYGWVKEEL
jgi:hypothetical protein